MRAIAMSRATIVSSASAGRPASPSEYGVYALVHLPALDEGRVLAVVRDHDLARGTPWRTSGRCAACAPSGTQLPSSLNTPHAGLDHLAHLGDRLPRQCPS